MTFVLLQSEGAERQAWGWVWEWLAGLKWHEPKLIRHEGETATGAPDSVLQLLACDRSPSRGCCLRMPPMFLWRWNSIRSQMLVIMQMAVSLLLRIFIFP